MVCQHFLRIPRGSACFRFLIAVEAEAALRSSDMVKGPRTNEQSPSSVLRWVRPPRQGRTREQLGRILEAAEQLVSQQGFDRVSVAEIAAAARTSVGGFYRRFPTKESLLHALHERFCEEAKVTASAVLAPDRWQGIPTPAVLQALVDFLIDVYQERQGLFRAILVRAISDSAANQRSRELFDHLAAHMGALLQERRGDFEHPDPKLGAPFVLRVMFGTLNHFLMLPEPREFPRAVLQRELARVLRTYLGVRAPHMATVRIRS